MSNTYGFDFLKSEHVLEDDGRPPVAQVDDNDELLEDGGVPDVLEGSDLFYQAQLKPDLEKQFDILAFLQAHRGSGGCLAPSVIYRKTGIDLQDPSNTNVANMLQHNPKVRVELVPDPENPVMVLPTYAYQAKYSSVVNASTLLAQINKMTGSGIAMRDLLDSYQTVADDIQTLIRGGDIIAISNTEDKDKILFPRGESFVVELDGLISLIPPPPKLTTEIPPNNQPEIKEGEEGSQQVKQEPYESQDSNNEQDSSSKNNTSTNQEDDTNKTDANSMPPPAAKEAKMEDEPEKPVEHFVVETDMDPRSTYNDPLFYQSIFANVHISLNAFLFHLLNYFYTLHSPNSPRRSHSSGWSVVPCVFSGTSRCDLVGATRSCTSPLVGGLSFGPFQKE